MKALDLYCGLGGWSNGLAMEGFDVLGVELVPKIAHLYEHNVIIADVRKLDGKRFKGFDLIVGSPPCRDFSITANFGKVTWNNPPDPEGKGLELVNAFLRIVEEAEPKYWLLENVTGLEKYIGIPPKCKPRLSKTMLRGFWGKFPSFLIPKDLNKKKILDIQGPLRKWERAMIPLPVARALGRAIKEAEQ